MPTNWLSTDEGERTMTQYKGFDREEDARDWAHRESLIYDTDEECREECERLLKSIEEGDTYAN